MANLDWKFDLISHVEESSEILKFDFRSTLLSIIIIPADTEIM